ncbi:GNAT family N-acetyltransferase [Actinoalloteichus spitiensis]|uniref:GNAT family N-acetyltransferase n=1 Tax=Actinoalloteichus spitiensis TaxID=252394 RepID=UPI00036507DF|nr:GNAT family protein [Actinoalloteichus spitiensis]
MIVPAGAVELRPPRLRDGGAWSAIRLRDRGHLERWEPSSAERWEERNGVLAWPSQYGALRRMGRQGTALPFVITVDGEFVGQLTIGNVIRGALCSAWVGYWVASTRVGGGVASAGVALAVDHAFHAAGLHRLEATVRPDNGPSLRVLEKVGFRREGLYRRYLNVEGGWHDHLCLAVTVEDLPGGAVRALVAQGRARLA